MRVARAERETDGNELSAETLLPFTRRSLRDTETLGPYWYHRDFRLVKELSPSCGKPLVLALHGETGDMGHAAQAGIFLVSE